ncbi:MAG: hypothetical protein J6W96_02900, partial [Alphaproteobacteria bacterium]|nr:hypothetical protein [Alphaproteobacteria bacterium]
MANSENAKKKKGEGFFSKLGKKSNSFRNRLFRSLYITFLFAIDFAFVIYSINGRLIENGVVNQAALVIIGSVFVVSLILMLLLSFSHHAQNFICAVVTMVIVAAFCYQFRISDVDNFVETWLNQHASWLTIICLAPSPWVLGFLAGLVIFFAFCFSDIIWLTCVSLLVFGAVVVQKKEFEPRQTSEYVEVKGLSRVAEEKRLPNVVYLVAPKLPSYQFLSSVRDVNFRELRDLMIGFFAINNFEIYPNAFVQKDDTMSNIIDIMNEVDYTSSASADRGFSTFVDDWNFVQGSLQVLNLESNKFYDNLRSKGLRISTYSMPGFDFCFTGENLNTDRCVVKNDKVISIYDPKSSLEKNVYTLIGEWLMSFHSRDLNSLAKTFISMSPLKNSKVLSENRRRTIEGSPAIFDKLADDIMRDDSGQVYFAYIDLPSDIYLYDEYCHLKNRKDWVALKDNSLYSGGMEEKRKAYIEQTKCLLGKLQEYMTAIDEKLPYTDVIIQGLGPIKELANMTGDQYGHFISDNLVALGIRKRNNPKFLINANICLASDFTKSYLNEQDYCYSLDNMMAREPTEDRYSLKKNLINNSIIRGGTISTIVGNFIDWYKLYRQANQPVQETMVKQVTIPQPQVVVEQQAADRARSQDSQNIFDPMEEVNTGAVINTPAEEPVAPQ